MASLDEVSARIGALEANTGALAATFARHDARDEERHQEVMAAIRGLEIKGAEQRGSRKAVAGMWAIVVAIGGVFAAWFGTAHH